MASYSEDLANQTQRVLRERGWTLRQAEIRTGIGYSTIHNMRSGKRVRPETIVSWADAIGEDRTVWLRAAGYDVVPASVTDVPPAPSPTPPPAEPQELTREPHYDDLHEEEREVYEFTGRVWQKVKDLPPGSPERKAYVQLLEAQARAALLAMGERIDEEEKDRKKGR